MSEINRVLSTKGIGYFDDIYSVDEMRSINAAIDPLFASRSHEKRSYVSIDDMKDLNILSAIFSPKMKDVLFSIANDPVLYHCHFYEIAGNSTRSHIFEDHLSGWHRDYDSEYFPNEATHVSVFVYFSPVGDGDGAFEFIPQRPLRWLWKSTPCLSVTGASGLSYAWNRAYFHRASPNRNSRRRRLLKISVQPNRFRSIHLESPNFQKVIAATPAGDLETDLLLGRYQGAEAPKKLPPEPAPAIREVAPNGRLGVSNKSLLKFQLRNQANSIKRRLRQLLRRAPEKVGQYD